MRFFQNVVLAAAVATPAMADLAAILQDFSNIYNGTISLTNTLNHFGGPKDSLNILEGVANVTKIVQKGIVDAKATPLLSVNDAVQLVTPTSNLATAVNLSITATLNQYWPLVNSGLGPETEKQLLKIQSGSNEFTAAVLAIIPSSLQQTAQQISAPIAATLQKGVDAFANTKIPNNVSYTSGASAEYQPVAAGAVLVAALAAML